MTQSMTCAEVRPNLANILPARIAIHAGHDAPCPVPDWTGTVAQYWEANDTICARDIAAMMLDLEECGQHRIGGGAQGCFTIRFENDREAIMERIRAVIAFRDEQNASMTDDDSSQEWKDLHDCISDNLLPLLKTMEASHG